MTQQEAVIQFRLWCERNEISAPVSPYQGMRAAIENDRGGKLKGFVVGDGGNGTEWIWLDIPLLITRKRKSRQPVLRVLRAHLTLYEGCYE